MNRYEWDYGGMEYHPEGDYIKHEDTKILFARVTMLEEALRKIIALNYDEYAEDIARRALEGDTTTTPERREG